LDGGRGGFAGTGVAAPRAPAPPAVGAGARRARTGAASAGFARARTSAGRPGVTGTVFFFSSRRRHTRSTRDWSSDVCSSISTSGWQGPFYIPRGAYLLLSSDGFYITRDSRAPAAERYWLGPDGGSAIDLAGNPVQTGTIRYRLDRKSVVEGQRRICCRR